MASAQSQQASLQKALWAAANDLRSNMDANEFRNYLLGMIFYRYLSQNIELAVAVDLAEEEETATTFAELLENYGLEYKESFIEELGYFIEPNDLFSTMIAEIQKGEFSVEHLSMAIGKLTQSTIGAESEDDFNHLFDDMDLESSRLGNSVPARSALIAKVMLAIDQIEMDYADADIDILGDAYEYLIGQFAASAGKKAGEFYTPQMVSSILAQVVTTGKEQLRSVYDPTAGSGSLLLRVGKEVDVHYYYGQELNGTTYNLARMNLLLHGVKFDRFTVRQGDTLENDQFADQKFDAVVANPPYSAKWSADPSKLDDARFQAFGKLAPKSKADFAFVQNMLYHLDDNGTMAVVLPHGVLFRGAAEGVIRRYMIEKQNVLDTVIGLPANLFYGTSIPTAILIFKKNRDTKDVLFIDASNEFEKGKNQNNLTDEHVEKIMKTFVSRETIDKYSYLATREEIIENDFNLNIPRYVDTFEEEEEIDLVALSQELRTLNQEITTAEQDFLALLNDLAVTEDSKDILAATKAVFDYE
ncbi:MAG: type I restriction-modification system subunit M [Enterococcus sp.]